MSNMDAELKRQIDIITQAFPGQLFLRLAQAGQVIQMSEATLFRLRRQGRAPFPIRQIGNKLVVHVDDIAHAVLGFARAPESPVCNQQSAAARAGGIAARGKSGRPKNSEVAEATRLGLTIKELREQRREREGGAT